MLLREETYKKAFEIKKNTLSEKRKQHNILLDAAYVSNKRLLEIDTALCECGAALALTAMSGDSAKLNELKNKSTVLSAEKKTLLEKCGIEDVLYDCPLCNDTGYVGGKICSCVKELAKQLAISELCEEMPLNDCRFDNFDLNYYSDKPDKDGIIPRQRMKGIYELCKNYADSFDPKKTGNLLFFGSTGLGKTHLTLAIVSTVINKGFMPIYGSAQNLFDIAERERFSNNYGGEGLQNMLTCDLLAIDDLGAEFSTAFSKSVLYNLINTRLLSHKPTVINTNLSVKEIEERYSPRILSRLIGNYESRRFLGNDIRQLKISNE